MDSHQALGAILLHLEEWIAQQAAVLKTTSVHKLLLVAVAARRAAKMAVAAASY